MPYNASPASGKQNFGNVPVVISAVIAVVAGIATAVFSSGGTERQFRWELGIAAACVAFITSLLIFLLLIITAKPNPEHLGKGTGVKRRFGALPDGTDSGNKPRPDRGPPSRPGGPAPPSVR